MAKTYLTADAAAAATSLTVRSINSFLENEILLIGEIGTERCEIVNTHATTAPSGSTITLVAAGTANAHSAGEPVYFIQWNRFELSRSATSGGTYTLLTTTLGSGLLAIAPEADYTYYFDSEFSTGFYRIRKNDTLDSLFSAYTDPIPATGYASNTAGYLIKNALKNNDATFSEKITHEWCMDEINKCLKHIQGKQLRWDEYHILNAILGQTVRGTHTYALSGLATEIYDNDSNKSITGVRIGDQANLIYKEPLEFEEILGDVKTTTTRSAASIGDTSLALTNSYDFDNSGTINVYVSGTLYAITYTGVTRDTSSGATGALTGVPASGTGSITVAIASGANVWQDEDEGNPKYYTIRNQQIEVWPLPSGTYDNMNARIDYWSIATEVDTDGDTIDEERFDMIENWLTWKINSVLRNNGKLDQTDGHYLLFREQLNDEIRTKRTVSKHRYKPRLNRIKY